MANQISTLKEVAYDVVKGQSRTGKFNKAEMNEYIKDKIREAVGGEWNYYNFKQNEYRVYAILAEMLPTAINASLSGRFEQFADFKDTALGDKNSFHVEDNQLFPVVTQARGTKDIHRTQLLNSSFSVTTSMKMIKVYAELDELMAGKIDFARMTERVATSFAHEVGLMISNAIYNSYSSVGTNFKATAAFDDDTLDDIIEHVKAATGSQAVQIFGSRKALKQVNNSFGFSDNMLDEANELGYVGTYNGTPLISLPQAYLARTQTFGVDRNHLIIVPANEKIVKVVFEGEPLVDSTPAMQRNDLQPEYLWGRMIGAAAITVQEGNYGFYKLS